MFSVIINGNGSKIGSNIQPGLNLDIIRKHEELIAQNPAESRGFDNPSKEVQFNNPSFGVTDSRLFYADPVAVSFLGRSLELPGQTNMAKSCPAHSEPVPMTCPAFEFNQ